MTKNWYKGDTHLHTTYSFDGFYTKGQLVDLCKNKGLDFMIITDHNANSVDRSYYDGDMLIIQGQELTDEPGHVNVWGRKVPLDPPYKLETAEDYKEIIDLCVQAGATISLNHPFCSNCPFRLDMEAYPFDCVEVWNTIQHSDNMKNRDWWVSQLLKGKHIAAVGGSDYHKNQAGIPLLAMPTTHVLAEEKTEEAILRALREGRSVITNTPDSTMIYLTCGEAQVGDTVKLSDNQKAEIKITNLRRGHRVLIYNNEKIIFDFTAKKNTKIFESAVDIEEKGFIRAEITYRFSPLVEKVYAFAENTFLSSRGVNSKKSNRLPDFLWAFTNPIWVK